MKRTVFLLIAVIIWMHGQSQELPLLSQRIFDAQYVNPGVVGARELIEITAHHRSQWLGFEGAPHTQVVSANVPIGYKVGVGGFAINDISGPARNFGFGLSYGYHLSFRQYSIGLGITAGMMRYQFDGGVLNMPDFGDPLWHGATLTSRFTPEFAVGAFLYDQRKYLGISVARLINIMPTKSGQLELLSNQRAHLIAGYDVYSTKDLVLTPSIFFTMSLNSAFIAEVGANASFFDLLIAGVYFRWNDAFIAQGGVRVNRNIIIAYTYDYSYTGLGYYSAGSHEVVVQVALSAFEREVCPVYRKHYRNKRRSWKY